MDNSSKDFKEMLAALSARFPTRALIAEALGVGYCTVAHWFDGSSLPSFGVTVRILRLLGWYGGDSHGQG